MAQQLIEKVKVLLVDDERLILRSLRRILAQTCEVLLADGYDQAERVLLAQAVDVVISDRHMPGRCGVDVLMMSKVLQPRAMRVMYSSDPPMDLEQLQGLGIIEYFVDKPHYRRLVSLLQSLSPTSLDKAS